MKREETPDYRVLAALLIIAGHYFILVYSVFSLGPGNDWSRRYSG